jgi:hypothetical protein
VHTLLVRGGKLIVAIVATWAVGASLYIFSSPVSVHGVTDVMLRDSNTVVTAFTREQPHSSSDYERDSCCAVYRHGFFDWGCLLAGGARLVHWNVDVSFI